MVTLHDIMTVDVVTVPPEATLREVAELLSSEHISGVPVVVGDEVVGVVSATDLLEFDAEFEGRRTEPEGGQLGFEDLPEADLWEEGEEPPASYFVRLWEEQDRLREDDLGAPGGRNEGEETLDGYTAADVMTRSLCALPPDATVREAAEYMLRAGVHRVLVVDDEGTLVGVATTTDVMKAVSQHGLAG